MTFEVLGHLLSIQARAALGDLAAADRHAAAADSLADGHGLPVVGVFTDWYAALRLAVLGEPDQARRAYRAAGARLRGTGMSGLEAGLLPLALLGVDALDPTPDVDPDAHWGPYEPWVRPLALFAAGRREEALAALRDVPESPRDLLFEARTCLHALAAVRAGDRPRMERLYAQLLPAAGELAGAGSGLLTLGPTAAHLGRLADALGRPDLAAAHHAAARDLADRIGAPHWATAARRALSRSRARR